MLWKLHAWAHTPLAFIVIVNCHVVFTLSLIICSFYNYRDGPVVLLLSGLSCDFH